MLKKRTRILLLSMLTICISVAIVVGSTYALFSDKATVNNHLEAGSLKVGLEQISYTEKSMNEQGILAEKPADTTIKNLVSDNANLFRIDKAVPNCWYEAKIKVTNKGNVAFDYGVKMLFNIDSSATDKQLEFAKQIKITITNDTINKEFALSDAKTNSVDLGTLITGNSSNVFTVKAEFVNCKNNNDVQTISIDFDMQVYATQHV